MSKVVSNTVGIIRHSSLADFFIFVCIPTMLSLLNLLLIKNQASLFYLTFFFLVAVVIDQGHAYATIWRVWVDRQQNKIDWIPVLSLCAAVAVLVGFAISRSVVALFFFFGCLLAWHGVRQFLGISAIYQNLNKRRCRITDGFIYLFTLVPLVLNVVLAQIQIQYFEICRGVYWLLVGMWIAFELNLYIKKQRFEVNRFFSILGPVIIYYQVYLTSPYGINFVPIAISHGLTYFFVVAHFSQSSSDSPKGLMGTFFSRLMIILLCCTILSILHVLVFKRSLPYPFNETVSIRNFLQWNFRPFTALEILYYSPVILPTTWHIFVDSFIWRKRHQGMEVYFSRLGMN